MFSHVVHYISTKKRGSLEQALTSRFLFDRTGNLDEWYKYQEACFSGFRVSNYWEANILSWMSIQCLCNRLAHLLPKGVSRPMMYGFFHWMCNQGKENDRHRRSVIRQGDGTWNIDTSSVVGPVENMDLPYLSPREDMQCVPLTLLDIDVLSVFYMDNPHPPALSDALMERVLLWASRDTRKRLMSIIWRCSGAISERVGEESIDRAYRVSWEPNTSWIPAPVPLPTSMVVNTVQGKIRIDDVNWYPWDRSWMQKNSELDVTIARPSDTASSSGA